MFCYDLLGTELNLHKLESILKKEIKEIGMAFVKETMNVGMKMARNVNINQALSSQKERIKRRTRKTNNIIFQGKGQHSAEN